MYSVPNPGKTRDLKTSRIGCFLVSLHKHWCFHLIRGKICVRTHRSNYYRRTKQELTNGHFV